MSENKPEKLSQEVQQEFPRPPQLTPEQDRARRRRNMAIAITIALLCVLFYAVTIAKLGPGILSRPSI